MGLLSAAMKRELQRASPSVFPLLEIDVSDPSTVTTLRYAKVGAMNALDPNIGTGHIYKPDALSFGNLSRQTSSKGSLATVSCTVTVRDDDLDFSKRVGRGERMLNAAARIYLGSSNVSRTDWFQLFGGVLIGWAMVKPNQWQLKLATPDIKLATTIPRYQTNTFDFPNLTKGAIGTPRSRRRVQGPFLLGPYTPLIYGKHDDYGDQGAGAVPCPAVDTVNFWNLVSLGWTNPVRVFVDNAIVTSGYTVTRGIINGRYYTYLVWTSDKSSNTVTVDIEGYETVGDGTGVMICDPVGVLQHIITNFVLNDYQSGTWDATDATFFDTTSWSALQSKLLRDAAGSGYACARYLSAQMTGHQILSEWCTSFGVVPYWTNAGLLAVGWDEPYLAYPNTYVSDPFLVYEETEPLALEFDGQSQRRKVIATFENIASGGTGINNSDTVPKEYYQIEVEDPTSLSVVDDHQSLTWGPSTFP